MPKINRALTWIRSVLDVTQKTSAPVGFDEDIRTVLDAFGWERLDEVLPESASAAAATSVDGSTVPADVLRLVTEAAVNVEQIVGADRTVWIEHFHVNGGVAVGVSRPLLALTVTGAPFHKAPLERWIVMRPGDILRGLSNPATGVGINLTLTQSFVELPIGEYVRSI